MRSARLCACTHGCVRTIICVRSGSSRARPTFLGGSIINCGGTIISVYFDPTAIRGVTDSDEPCRHLFLLPLTLTVQWWWWWGVMMFRMFFYLIIFMLAKTLRLSNVCVRTISIIRMKAAEL